MIVWIVVRRYSMDGGEALCGFTNESEANAMCAELTRLIDGNIFVDEDRDPPYDENGQPRDTEFKRYVRTHFDPVTEAYKLLMDSAEKFHQTEFEVKELGIR